MNNINDTYFDGYYKDIWRSIIPEELTTREVNFMLSYFELEAGAKVLDLMCGYGRHAIALARKGIQVTAIDNLHAYITEITEICRKEELPVKAISADVISYDIDEHYDLVICMGNSLNFFDATDTLKLISNISAHLKPGGKLLINTWSIAEIAIKSFQEKSWTTIGELKCLNDSKFLFHPARIETNTLIQSPDGVNEEKTAIDYIFSINEIDTMMRRAGLVVKEIYSIPGKKKFSIGDPRAYIIYEIRIPQ